VLLLAGWAAMTGPARAQSPKENFHRQEKLATAGNVKAMRQAGISYLTGHGTAKNDPKGFQWVSRAAKAGDGEAMYYVSLCYQRGVGVGENQAAASEWLQRSAKAGFSPSSQDLTTRIGASRPANTDNMKNAFQNYARLAAGGDATAMGELGQCYIRGLGTEPDPAKAVEMFQRGANAGNSRCIHDLGGCYAMGRGVTQDWAKAFSLFQRGADAGDPISMHDLAMCYYEGEGVKPNPVEAKNWFTKASKGGYNPSRQALVSLAKARRSPRAGARGPMTNAQGLAAIGLLFAFSQMMGSGPSPSNRDAEREELSTRIIERNVERDRQETEARIQAREQGIPEYPR